MSHDLILEITVGGIGRLWPDWLCYRHKGTEEIWVKQEGVNHGLLVI